MFQRGFSGSSFIAAVVLLPSTAPLSPFSDVGDLMGATTLSIPEISNQCERNMAVVFYDADDEAVTTIAIDRFNGGCRRIHSRENIYGLFWVVFVGVLVVVGC